MTPIPKTLPAELAKTLATTILPAEATTSTGSHPARRIEVVYPAVPNRGSPIGEPGHRAPRPTARPRSGNPPCPVDTWPLYAGDPVQVDGYRLIARLGQGGTADVFYAEAPSGRPVAMKILRPHGARPEACLREFRMTSAVDAQCTAPALGHGVSPAGAYLVTALLPGYRCCTTLQGGRPLTLRLWNFGAALARVLAAVHARGLVHCDVKPSNLLVRDHDVRLIDFGIARYVGQPCGGNGIVECSRGWAAPEQLRAAPATPAVDIFAWGCLMAYLTAGVHPFASSSDQEWILRMQSTEPDLSSVPPGLADMIRATLARSPLDRPSAPELVTFCLANRIGQPSPLP
ncbi:serine/threonine-protein kinase [Paractinoplanes rishiriensis]|uniref:non-specific serine/threonine protein kinase n=1 Tax=Paractinoplanes rishiriensis TaxID=1050105 RepID=A0A919K7P6_9ACTN|nr:serine/threonine-protein kinase [Actinoplanes rishiriensis]GIF00908.1 hypothetical protein Ari01nite_83720 [Actinoplanes rishiriensis]